MATREAVAKTLAVFGALFPRDITPELVSIYHAALSDVSDDALRVAMGKCVQTARFFPQPAEIRDTVGANAKPLPDVDGIVERLKGMCDYHPQYGTTMPRVERVRAELGDAIADAYGFVGPKRLEAVVFGGEGTGADIAAREFAEHLLDAQQAGAEVRMLQPVGRPMLSAPSVTLYDARPAGGFKRLASGADA